MQLRTFYARDDAGNLQYNPLVHLYQVGTTIHVSGLEDEDGNPLSNPFTGTNEGVITFAAPDGEYDMRVVADTRDRTRRVQFLDASANIALTEQYRDEAELIKNQTQAIKAAAEGIVANAQAIVVSGDVALVPTAGQVPLARSDAYINPNWVPKSLEPVQAIENPSATTGLIIPDDTQYLFTPQMSQQILAFVPATLTQEMQIYRQGEYGVYLTTDKKLRVNWGGSYQTIEPITVSDDWVDIQFSYNDNESSAVTFDVNVNYFPFGSQQVFAYSDAYIRNIFADDYGFLHVASMGYGHQTNAALLKMNNWGDACGSLPSVAGAAVTLAQATGTARPVIGRMPVGDTVRNVLLNTENLDAAYWSTRTNINVRKIIQPDGLVVHELRDTADESAESHVFGHTSAFPLNTNNTRRILAKKGTRSSLEISGANDGSFNRGVRIDLEAGVIASAPNVVNVNIEASENYPDFWEISFSATDNSSSASRALLLRICDGANRTYVGDGTGTVYVAEIYAERGTVLTGPYQRVGATARDVTESGVLDQEYLYFDAADDVLSGTISAITGGEIIIAGRNGIWHDSLTVAAGTFQIGPSTYTGGPAGILSLIGDFIGCAVLDRAFTTAERDALRAFFMSRGAPGWFSVDSTEIMPNPGDPFTSLDNWTQTAGRSTIELVADAVRITGVTSSYSVGQAFPRNAGESYLIDVAGDLVSGTAPSINVAASHESATNIFVGGLAPGRSVMYSGTTSASVLRLRSGFADVFDVTRFSVRKLILNTGA